MSATYTTRQGETVDIVCHRHYGRTSGVTESVLDANPGLAARGPILPMGTTIVLPRLEDKLNTRPLVSLWD